MIDVMLKDARDDKTMSLVDKCRVVDRALQLEKIKQKIEDESWGAGFQTDNGEYLDVQGDR